jgi:hypothetical protein
MADARRQTGFVFGASLLVLLCTGVLVWAPGPQLASSLPVSSSQDAPYQAFVVFRSADCDGNLSFAHVFERPRYRSSFRLTGIVLDAEPGDAGLRSKLRHAGVRMRLVGANRDLRRSIAAVSKEPGPLLVIVDGVGQLRTVTVTPKTPAEMRQFLGLLNSHTTAPQ